mgnify:CR=1 FL=1
MNFISFAGYAAGAFFSEIVAEYLGYKRGLVLVSLIQLVAVNSINATI